MRGLADRSGPRGRRSGRQDHRDGNSRAGGAQCAIAHGPLSRARPERKRPGKAPRERRIQTIRPFGYNFQRSQDSYGRTMKLADFRSIVMRTLLFGLCVGGSQHAAPLQGSQTPANAQSSSKSKAEAQSKSRKVANPLNDLLDEAQRDIHEKEFEPPVPPLQTATPNHPQFAYPHLHLT